MENIKVKNVIIGKQFEYSENLQKVLKIMKEKKINLKVVEAGNRINIEKNLYFDVFWPDSSNMISENAINNNALVCKLYYKNFSILFTGDIEEEAEKLIFKSYENNQDKLKTTVLKVAHHGSNTSSIEKILEAVSPQSALIGVGKNNKYGHPNDEVIERLEDLRSKSI